MSALRIGRAGSAAELGEASDFGVEVRLTEETGEALRTGLARWAQRPPFTMTTPTSISGGRR